MEIWKDIPGYKGLYQVSDKGRVQSLDKSERCRKVRGKQIYRTRKGRIIKPFLSKWGYLIVKLSSGGTAKHHTVHRLVMLTFAGKSKLCVNHKNGIRIDNNLVNLEYCTHKENSRHMIEILGNGRVGSQVPNAKLNEQKVKEIYAQLKDGHNTVEMADKYGVDKSLISLIKRRKIWKHVKG